MCYLDSSKHLLYCTLLALQLNDLLAESSPRRVPSFQI